jgi:methionine synthase I (cobalamin-dependent)
MLLDGAVGTELMAAGLRPRDEPPELWNRTRPLDVQRVYRAYFDAGADAVQTNTFGANRVRLASYGRVATGSGSSPAPGSPAEVRALNVAGALLAREVRPPDRFVIGSIGPTGAVPPPEGLADLGLLEDVFAEQAAALAEGGVDLLHLETFYHPKEARAALRGVRQGAPAMKIVASMTCTLTPSGGYATTYGYAPEVMLAVFLEEEADGVGANCTLGPMGMLELVRMLRTRAGGRPVFAKPTTAPGPLEQVSSAELTRGALALFEAGATAVGGCCGTTPADIAALRVALGEKPGI